LILGDLIAVERGIGNGSNARHPHAAGIEDRWSADANAMVCHILEGEMRIDQEGKVFSAKKNFCWTCNKDTKEQAFNEGSVVAVMRITDLKA